MKMNEKINKSVEKFANAIVEEIKDINYNVEVDLDYELCDSEDGKQQAKAARIATDFGIVIVLPDFKNKSCAASILNLNAERVMRMEGFDEEFIDKNARIWGNFLTNDKKNVSSFAYYLSHKVAFA